jgi:hypothetical protein
MARTDVHTAIGGMQLGMSVPLAGLSAVLAVLGGPTIGLEGNTSDVALAALSLLSGLLLAVAGTLLLWGHAMVEPNPRPQPRSAPRVAVKVYSRRSPPTARPQPRPMPPAPVGPPVFVQMPTRSQAAQLN